MWVETRQREKETGGEGSLRVFSFSLGFLLSFAKNDLCNHLDLEDF